MKSTAFIVLLLASSSAIAKGPIYQQKDATVQQEFQNVYYDISQARTSLDPLSISSATITAATITSLSVSTITAVSSATITNLRVSGTLSGVTLGKVLQVVQGNTTSNFSSSSASFVDTNLSGSITPAATTSKVLVLVTMVLNCSGTSNVGGRITVKRGSTNILDATGQGQSNSGTSGNTQTLNAMWLDSPSATTSTTYTVQGVYDGTGGSCSFGNGRTQSIELLEIGA